MSVLFACRCGSISVADGTIEVLVVGIRVAVLVEVAVVVEIVEAAEAAAVMEMVVVQWY